MNLEIHPQRHAKLRLALITLLLTCGLGNAWAEDRREHSTADAPSTDELAWELPAAPKAENLLPFYISTTTGQSFAVDAASLTVGKDGIVRYTMVGTSAGGAKNVSYEGIRCMTMEKKLFAFGHADGSWAKARDPQWDAIQTKGANLQHANLATDFLCKNSLSPGHTKQILDDLRYHRGQAGQL